MHPRADSLSPGLRSRAVGFAKYGRKSAGTLVPK